MFVFNIDDVLDEIKDLSAQEKIKVLDEAYEELEAAMEELVSTKEEIEDQYEREVQQKVNEAVKKHIKERGIQHAVKIENGMIECDYKDFGVCISPNVCNAEWMLSIVLTRTVRLWQLEEIAGIIDVHYNKNMGKCNVPVEEDELIPKTLDIINKLLTKK